MGIGTKQGVAVTRDTDFARSLIGFLADFEIAVQADFASVNERLELDPDSVLFLVIDARANLPGDSESLRALNRVVARECIPLAVVEALDRCPSVDNPFPSSILRAQVGPTGSLSPDFGQVFVMNVINPILYRNSYKHSLNGICTHRMVFDGDGMPWDCEYLQVNRAYETVTGLTPELVLGKTFRAFFTDEDSSDLVRMYWEVLSSGRSGARTLHFRPFSQWYKIMIVPLSRTLFTLIIENVTEIQESGRTLEEVRNDYKAIIDSGLAMVWTSGADGKCDYFNEPWLSFTGRKIDDELGDGWTAGVHPDDVARCLETYVAAFDRRERFDMEYRLRNRAGEYRWIQDLGSPRYDTSGKFLGYVGHCLDIHSRKVTERDLAEKMVELQRFHRLAVDRESRMVDLKREINSLRRDLGLGDKYPIRDE
jgi:PAS domain S-box-containing protein